MASMRRLIKYTPANHRQENAIKNALLVDKEKND
jgi:hypothetical protein